MRPTAIFSLGACVLGAAAVLFLLRPPAEAGKPGPLTVECEITKIGVATFETRFTRHLNGGDPVKGVATYEWQNAKCRYVLDARVCSRELALAPGRRAIVATVNLLPTLVMASSIGAPAVRGATKEVDREKKSFVVVLPWGRERTTQWTIAYSDRTQFTLDGAASDAEHALVAGAQVSAASARKQTLAVLSKPPAAVSAEQKADVKEGVVKNVDDLPRNQFVMTGNKDGKPEDIVIKFVRWDGFALDAVETTPEDAIKVGRKALVLGSQTLTCSGEPGDIQGVIKELGAGGRALVVTVGDGEGRRDQTIELAPDAVWTLDNVAASSAEAAKPGRFVWVLPARSELVAVETKAP